MSLVRKLWYILGRRERVEGSLLVCGTAIGALLEALSIGLVVPFVAVLQEPQLVLRSHLAQPVVTALEVRTPEQLIGIVSVGLIAAFFVKSSYLLLLYRWLFRFVYAMQVSLSRRLLARYLGAPYAFHLARNSAEAIKAMTGTLQGLTSGFFPNLIMVIGEVFVVVALVILLMAFDALTTLSTVAVLAIPTALIYSQVRKQLAVSGCIAEESFSAVILWTEQAINGLKSTIITGGGGFFLEKHTSYMQRFAQAWRTVAFLSVIPRLVIDTLALSAILAICLVNLLHGASIPTILPTLGMFAAAAIRLMPSTTRIANGLAQLRFLHATLDVIYNELRALDNSQQPLANNLGQRDDPPLRIEHSLTLDAVSYRYPMASRNAVEGVSFAVPSGQWVALVGPSGAGKTTLLDLLLGLLRPDSGRVLIDGRDLRDHLEEWRGNIGYVPQDIYLLDDTIRRNVAFAVPDDRIDDNSVWRALRAAEIDAVVSSLPEGLNALIGQRGSRLSGGERQRMAIARALYHDPQLLVVDEGTASLDNPTETAIIETLSHLRGEKTILVVTHRLTMVKDANMIYFIKNGALESAGTYIELVTNCLPFRQFANVEEQWHMDPVMNEEE